MPNSDGSHTMYGYLYAAIVQRTGLDGMREWSLGRHFEQLGWGIGDLLAATDEQLLQAKGFGPKALERWRSVIPTPVREPRWIDPWRNHALMVAGVPI